MRQHPALSWSRRDARRHLRPPDPAPGPALHHGSWPVVDGRRLAARGWRLAAGGWRLAARGWRLAAGGWRLAAGGWRLAAGGWRLAAGGWRLIVDARLTLIEVARLTFEA